jgi:adenylate cyclase
MTFAEQQLIVNHLDPPRLRRVAIMFVDLDNFTRICAQDPPERAFRLARDFQHFVTTCVLRFKGRLNACLGDGAMATFKDLTAAGRSDCATRALQCAHSILDGIPALNFEHLGLGGQPISASIGLQYGEAVFGALTGSRRFGPMVIGDTVNVANRLEQRAHALSARMVAGDDLVQKARLESGSDVSELAHFRHIGPLAVSGRDDPVDVWTFSACRQTADAVTTSGRQEVGAAPSNVVPATVQTRPPNILPLA